MTVSEKRDRDRYIALQYQQGARVNQLASQYQISEQAVYNILRKEQVDIKRRVQFTHTIDEDRQFLERIERENKQQLAQEFGVSYNGLFAKKRAAEARMWRRQKG